MSQNIKLTLSLPEKIIKEIRILIEKRQAGKYIADLIQKDLQSNNRKRFFEETKLLAQTRKEVLSNKQIVKMYKDERR